MGHSVLASRLLGLVMTYLMGRRGENEGGRETL